MTPTQITRDDEQDLTSLLDCFPEMLAVLSAGGRLFAGVNAALQDAIGPREWESHRMVPFYAPDPSRRDVQLATQRLDRTVLTGDKVSFRSRYRGAEGRDRWIHWKLRRARNSRQVYAIAQDVTDQYTAEQELARANEILSAVLLSAPLPIWASDPEGRVQFWNGSAEQVLGWTAEEVLNGIPPDPLPKCSGPQGRRLAGERMSWRRRDGSSRDLRFWTAPLHENGAECGTLGMTVDVTVYDAELYGALQQAYDDLRHTREAVMQHERLRVLGQMASGIAHDINNALSPVKLYTQTLLEDEKGLTANGRRNLKTIRNAIDDVCETVARMREFYRLREPELTLTPVNLNDIVQQVVDLTRARWRDMSQQAGVVIQAVTELAENPPSILGIESEIREAVANLIFNAVDAMPAGGTLTLRTGVLKGVQDIRQVYVEVADTGSGMGEEDTPALSRTLLYDEGQARNRPRPCDGLWCGSTKPLSSLEAKGQPFECGLKWRQADPLQARFRQIPEASYRRLCACWLSMMILW